MTSRDKLRALVLVWAAVIIICMVTFLGKSTIGIGEGVLGFFYMVFGTAISIAITESKPATEADTQSSATREKSKLKRESTTLIDRLVESMDDDERAALLQRLGAGEEDDGLRTARDRVTHGDRVVITDDGELRTHR